MRGNRCTAVRGNVRSIREKKFRREYPPLDTFKPQLCSIALCNHIQLWNWPCFSWEIAHRPSEAPSLLNDSEKPWKMGKILELSALKRKHDKGTGNSRPWDFSCCQYQGKKLETKQGVWGRCKRSHGACSKFPAFKVKINSIFSYGAQPGTGSPQQQRVGHPPTMTGVVVTRPLPFHCETHSLKFLWSRKQPHELSRASLTRHQV